MTCCGVRAYLQAFVDHELSPERCIEIEQHLGACSECRAEVELTRALCQATRVSVVQCAVCPSLHSRWAERLEQERNHPNGHSVDPLSFRVIASLAAAAVLTLFLSTQAPSVGPDAVAHAVPQTGPNRTVSFQESASGSGRSIDRSMQDGGESAPELIEASSQDGLMDFLIRHHAARFEPEVVEANSVNHLESHLGFRVRTPDFGRYGARFEGANLVPVNRTRAAVLHYNLGGKRVTLYMYNPDELSLRAQRSLTPQVVGNRAVFVGHRRGYSIATYEREGVGYAVATDLSGEESAELVAALDL